MRSGLVARRNTARARVLRRFVITARIPISTAEALLPPQLVPEVVGGSAVWSSCPYELEGVGPAFIPRAFGLRAVCSAPRISALLGETPVAYVLRRDSNSRLVAAGARPVLGLPFERRHASIECSKDGYAIRIGNTDDPHRVHASLVAADETESTLFSGPAEFENHFCCDRAVSPASGRIPARGLLLDSPGTTWSALRVVNAAIGGLPDGAHIDSAWLGTGGDYLWQRSATGIPGLETPAV